MYVYLYTYMEVTYFQKNYSHLHLSLISMITILKLKQQKKLGSFLFYKAVFEHTTF